MALSELSLHRNKATLVRSRSRTLISRDRSFFSKSIRGLDLWNKIRASDPYPYISRRRLYTTWRVFFFKIYTMYTEKGILAGWFQRAARRSRIQRDMGASFGAGIKRARRRLIILSFYASIDPIVRYTKGLLANDRLVEPTTISSTVGSPI